MLLFTQKTLDLVLQARTNCLIPISYGVCPPFELKKRRKRLFKTARSPSERFVGHLLKHTFKNGNEILVALSEEENY